jgi:hypothetical protein
MNGRDAEQWRRTRLGLNARRHQLAIAAGRLYPGVPRVGGTGLLCRPEWIPDRPVDLDQVRLRWTEPAPRPAVSGDGPESAQLRPEARAGQRYPAYADAMAALAPPALFENRPTYRPLAADLAGTLGGGPSLDLTRGRYYDAVSVAEALAHELAAVLPDDQATSMDRLPFRAAVGDPCDLARRPASVAISTLAGAAALQLAWTNRKLLRA